MLITWDDHKYRKNLAKHRLDFEDLTEEFFLDALILPAKHGRWMAIGELDGIITVIFVYLGTEGLSGHFDAPRQP
jgi:uncharacterized DUF497 family protein